MGTFKLGIYKHYKNKLYLVIGEATHSETNEIVIVYQCLYGNRELWVRPKYVFFETVVYKNNIVPRFEFISNKQKEINEMLKLENNKVII